MAWVCGYAGVLLVPNAGHVPLWVFAVAVCTLAWSFVFLRWKTISLLLLLAVAASGYYVWNDSRNTCTSCSVIGETLQTGSVTAQLEGVIDSPVTVDGDRASFILAVRSMRLEEGSVSPVHDLVKVNVHLLQQSDQTVASHWKRADQVRFQGELSLPQQARNFGGFDYRKYLRIHHIYLIASSKGLASVFLGPLDRSPIRLFLRSFDKLRDRLSECVEQLFHGDQAGYMKGLLLGFDDDMDPEQYGQFTTLGLTHVLAISGMHVGVLMAVLLWIFRRLRLTRETGMNLTMAMLPVYIILTGASPSVVRAGLMGMCGMFLLKRGVLHTALDLAVAVGWAMLLWNPYYILDVGFQLSFAVTIGLIAVMPAVQRLLPRRFPMLEGSAALTLVAQLLSFPLSIYYFNQFSLLSWLANLALVPLISFVVTPMGGAALFVSMLSERIGEWLAWPVLELNKLTFTVTSFLSAWRAPILLWPSPPLWWLAVYYGGLAFWLKAHVRRKERQRLEREGVWLEPSVLQHSPIRRKLGRAFPIALAAGLLVYSYLPDARSRVGSVEFLDVGQGDAIYIRTPEGRHILVDGGGTVTFRKPGDDWRTRRDPFEIGRKLLAPLLKKRGVHQFDLVVATHEDADHIGGLQAIIEQFPVARFAFNGTIKDSAVAKRLLATIVKERIPLLAAETGEHMRLDRYTTLDVLAPDSIDAIEELSKQNTRSVVLLLTMYGKRILLTGDMEAPAEAMFLADKRFSGPVSGGSIDGKDEGGYGDSGGGGSSGDVPPIDVLKVAHHGSKTSTTEAWLSYWKPRTAVISVGARNVYGHPNPQVLERLSRDGVQTLRTDERGEVRVQVGPNSDQLSIMTGLQEP